MGSSSETHCPLDVTQRHLPDTALQAEPRAERINTVLLRQQQILGNHVRVTRGEAGAGKGTAMD